METFVAAINAARANPPDLAQLMTPPPNGGRGGGPAAPRPAPAAPPAVASEKLADGVYRITGGYVALAVEFRDSRRRARRAGRAKRAAWRSSPKPSG